MKTNTILLLLFGVLIHPLAAAVNGFRLNASYNPSNNVLTLSATNLETTLFTLEGSADLGGPWTKVAANFVPAQRFDFVETNLDAGARRFFRGRLESAYVPGELLVLFRRGVPPNQRDSVLQSVGATNRETILTRPMQANGLEPIFRALTTNPVFSTVQALRARPEVDHAEPVWLARFAAAANDPCYMNGEQWGLYAPDTVPSSAFGSKAAKAWAAGFTGSPSVCVGVIDTGIQISHPDLAPNIWTNPRETPNDNFDSDANGYSDDDHGWDFVNKDRTVDDGITVTSPHGELHGTQVAGIIGAVGGNGTNIAGVNWSVSLIPVKAGEGSTGIRVDDAFKALDYLTQLKTDGVPIAVINASWGFSSDNVALHEALLRAARADILIVAAVGNDGLNIDITPVFPACSDTSVWAALSSGGTNQAPATFNAVIAVAAIQSDGRLASGVFDSNYGATKAALGAPGKWITTTVPYFGPGSNSTDKDNGTSFAAAFVSGAVALYKSTHCIATAPQIKQALLGAAAQTPFLLMGKIFGERRLDLSTVIGPGSLLCPDVWVDVAYTGPCLDGTSARPFRMISQGHQAAVACTTTIHIRAGTYTELPLLLDKPVLFVPEGGPVSIGP